MDTTIDIFPRLADICRTTNSFALQIRLCVSENRNGDKAASPFYKRTALLTVGDDLAFCLNLVQLP
tara:strand:- start:1914 stop:2111 length:198 start_codon:yes stop_codon:yes gene_type:complete